MAAAYNAAAEVTRALIRAGADVNARADDGITALMKAAMANENLEVIMTLIEAGADGSAVDEAGKTAFDYAEDNDAITDTEVYRLLNDLQIE